MTEGDCRERSGQGANTFAPTVPLRIAVCRELRATALLLAADGRAPGGHDVVTAGAPAHPSSAVRLAGGAAGTAWLEAGLGETEADVERVLVIGSTRGGTASTFSGSRATRSPRCGSSRPTHTEPTALPNDDNFINETGARRETHPLPEGPVIVEVSMADGPWRARLKGIGQTEDDVPDDDAAAQTFAPFIAPQPGQSDTGRRSSPWGWLGRG